MLNNIQRERVRTKPHMIVAIDMGTCMTRIAVSGRGLVCFEPTMVADCPGMPVAVAVGQNAALMQGKLPGHMMLHHPIHSGHLAAPLAAQVLLSNLLKRAGLKSWSRPELRWVAPSQATPVERSHLMMALKTLGLGRLQSVSMPVACAYGALESPTQDGRLGAAILDIGSHVSEFSIVASDIVMREHIAWGSSDLDRELREYLNQEFELEISESVSERLKQNVGCQAPDQSGDFLAKTPLFVARDRSTGLPVERQLDVGPLTQSLESPLQNLVELCRRVLDELPPLLARDVLEKGLMLTGGGSHLTGLPQWLSGKLQLPVHLASEAQNCGVLGALKVPAHLCKDF